MIQDDDQHYELSLLKTGDLVFFSGKGPLSVLVQIGTRSQWSHIGMIVHVNDEPCIWESRYRSRYHSIKYQLGRTTLPPSKPGVSTTPLRIRLRHFDGKISVRPLKHPLTEHQLISLSQFREEVKDRPYEKHGMELLKAIYDGPGGQNAEDLSSFFCSELVAETYQRLGLLVDDKDGGKPSNEYTPKDFTPPGRLELQLNNALGPQILLRPRRRRQPMLTRKLSEET